VRRCLVPTVLAFSVFFSSFSGASAAPTAHVLRFASAEEIATLNPDLGNQLVVAWLSQMTGAYLFRDDASNRLTPELATVVPTQANGGISKDGLTVTLHIRSGVKWSDGAPFDANDVAFSIAALNNVKNNVPNRDGFDRITRVDVPNSTTAIVHLKEPFGAIVARLFATSNAYMLLPKHVLGSLSEINDAPYNGLPIGIGPFRYKAWKRGDAVELERNPLYWRGKAALDEVIYKILPDRNTVLLQLQTQDLDLFYPFGGAFLPRVQAIPGTYIVRHPSYAVNELLFNTASPPLREAAVRRALRYATDRATLREKIGHGVGLLQDAVFTQADPSTPKDIAFTPFDLAKANKILDDAGWVRGADGIRAKAGVRLDIDIASSQGTPDADQQIELIRANWKEIGADMNVTRYQSSILFGPYASGGILPTGKFGAMFLGNLIPAPFDLANSFGCNNIPPAGQNFNRFCDHDLDGTIAEYNRTYDDATRKRLIAKVAHVVEDQALTVTITGREDLFGLLNAVKNFHPNNATPFDDMMHVDVVP
jgi:peptide/nickel transport system substrate-binding protein